MLNNLRIMFVFSIFFGLMNAQSSIEGSVTDSNGNPLAGANVVVDGTSVGAASGADGTYQINIPSGTVEGQTVTLVTSYIGYKSQSANVDVPLSGSITMNFSLEEAVALTSYNASKYMNLDNIGVIQKNFLSNFLVLDKEFNLKEVYLRGKKINV